MGSTLIHASYVLGVVCIIAFGICLAYDFGQSRKIRNLLLKDYGEECCKMHQIAGTDSSPKTQVGEQAGGEQAGEVNEA